MDVSPKLVVEIFQELNNSGLTIVMATHNLELARNARRLVELRDGHVTGMADNTGMISAV